MRCPHCQQSFDAPACASTEHKRLERDREFGIGKGSVASKSYRRGLAIARNQRAGTFKICPTCEKSRPTAAFWDSRRNRRTRQCSTCLFQGKARSAAVLAARARKVEERQAADRYWDDRVAKEATR